jgi:hypothetical protein
MGAKSKVRKLAFTDLEATGLHRDRRAWEVGVIVRDLDAGTQTRPERRFVNLEDLDLPNANPHSLEIGDFYRRHPEITKEYGTFVYSEGAVAAWFEELTRDAHIVGAVPNFDTDTMTGALTRAGLLPAWHYHLIDVEALAVGWLAGRGWLVLDGVDDAPEIGLPWNSSALSEACGVDPAPPELRHTALGDADWAMRLFDVVTGGAYALPGGGPR